jgi:hypothetical protein
LGQPSGKDYDRCVSFFRHLSQQLKSSIAEPELCRRSGDDAKINCLRDVKDVGNIVMMLATKSNDSERRLDTERYSSHVVDFLRRTSTESARCLEHVCLLPLPIYPFRTCQLRHRSTPFSTAVGGRVICYHLCRWLGSHQTFVQMNKKSTIHNLADRGVC